MAEPTLFSCDVEIWKQMANAVTHNWLQLLSIGLNWYSKCQAYVNYKFSPIDFEVKWSDQYEVSL